MAWRLYEAKTQDRLKLKVASSGFKNCLYCHLVTTIILFEFVSTHMRILVCKSMVYNQTISIRK